MLPSLYLIHIICAIIWAGGLFIVVLFVMPAAKALGPDGGKFMQKLAATNKYPTVMLTMATLTLVSGLGLLDALSNHFKGDWFSTTPGLVLTIGSIAGIGAYLAGILIQRPAIMKAGKIAAAAAQAGAPPSEEQQAQMIKLQKKATGGAHMTMALAFIAAICMIMAKFSG